MQKAKDGSQAKTEDDNVLSHLIKDLEPDIICLQEIKCSTDEISNCKHVLEAYKNIYINCASKKGYSGVAVLSKLKPCNVFKNFDYMSTLSLEYSSQDFLTEGRLLTLEFETYFVVNCYTVNSKQKLERLDQRVNLWESLFRIYINILQEEKHVIVCGDLNVAPDIIDIHTIKGHTRSAGFTHEEKDAFNKLLSHCKLVDGFRILHPNKQEFTYFSNFAKSRERNKGWRIDHILVSKSIEDNISDVSIHREYFGSDHVPVFISFNPV
jgi:exodeoxyribonuclease-3